MSLSTKELEDIVDETFAPSSHGMSQDELMAEFQRLDQIVKDAATERKDIAMALAGIAYEQKNTQNTVHLRSTGGLLVDVVFGTETEFVVEELLEVAGMLGKEQFDKLFNTKVEFTPRKRDLKMFMNTVFPDERIETAKKMIADATITKDKTPYVSLAKK